LLSPLFSSSLTLLFFFLSFKERHQRVFPPFSFSFSPHPSPPTFSQWQTERDLPTRHRRPTSECDFLSVEKRRETGCIPSLRRQGGSDNANQPRCLFLLFPSLVAPFTTSMTSLTSSPGRLARWLGVEAEVEGGKSSPLRFLFPPRGRRKPSDVFFFLDSGAGSPLSSRFSRFSLPVSAPPRHVTARTAPTSLRASRQAREKEGEAKRSEARVSFFSISMPLLPSPRSIGEARLFSSPIDQSPRFLTPSSSSSSSFSTTTTHSLSPNRKKPSVDGGAAGAPKKDFTTAILERKKSPNRLIVDDATNDDNR